MGLTAKDLQNLGPAARQQVLNKLSARGIKLDAESKYRSQKAMRVMPNGETMTFDSQREASRYDQLNLMLAAGRISDLRLQVDFTLQEAYTDADGNRIRAIRYRADFTYQKLVTNKYMSDPGGCYEYCDEWVPVVEDVKGIKTKEYSLKKKLMAEKFGITIQEV